MPLICICLEGRMQFHCVFKSLNGTKLQQCVRQAVSAKLTPKKPLDSTQPFCFVPSDLTFPNSAMSLTHGGLPSTLPADVLAELKETAARLCAPGPRADADVKSLMYFDVF